MKIIPKYLLKELAGPFLASLFVSTIILAAGNIVQTTDMVMNKGVEFLQVVKIFFLFLPYVLIFTIPISVLSGVLLGFGRLSGDNEITALRTSGVGIYKIVGPVIICGFIISLMCVPLNDKILPQSEFAARKLLKKVGVKHPAALLESGVFIKGFENYTIWIQEVKGTKLRGITIYQPREDAPSRTIVAKSGEIISKENEESVKLRLFDGVADEISAENPGDYYELTFKEYQVTLNLEGTMGADTMQKKPREQTIEELLSDIKKFEKDKINVTMLRIELHKKLALAFSNVVFVIVGIPLAITTHRREKFIGFGLAIVLFLVYWAVMLSGIAFAIRGILPAWISVWFANIALLVYGVRMFYKVVKL